MRKEKLDDVRTIMEMYIVTQSTVIFSLILRKF